MGGAPSVMESVAQHPNMAADLRPARNQQPAAAVLGLLYCFLGCAAAVAAAAGNTPGMEYDYGLSPKFVCTPVPPEADPACFSPPLVSNTHGSNSNNPSGSRRAPMSDEAKATILHMRESLVRQKETILDQRETIRELTAKLTLCEGFGGHHGNHHDNHHGNHHDEDHPPHHGPLTYHSSDHRVSHAGGHESDPRHSKGSTYEKTSSFSPEQTGKTLQSLKERLENLQARNSTSSYSSSLRELLQRKIHALEEQLHSYHSDHHGNSHHDDHHGDRNHSNTHPGTNQHVGHPYDSHHVRGQPDGHHDNGHRENHPSTHVSHHYDDHQDRHYGYHNNHHGSHQGHHDDHHRPYDSHRGHHGNPHGYHDNHHSNTHGYHSNHHENTHGYHNNHHSNTHGYHDNHHGNTHGYHDNHHGNTHGYHDNHHQHGNTHGYHDNHHGNTHGYHDNHHQHGNTHGYHDNRHSNTHGYHDNHHSNTHGYHDNHHSNTHGYHDNHHGNSHGYHDPHHSNTHRHDDNHHGSHYSHHDDPNGLANEQHNDSHHGDHHEASSHDRELLLNNKDKTPSGHRTLETVLRQLHHHTPDHGNPKSPGSFLLDLPIRSSSAYARMKRSLLTELSALTMCVRLKAADGGGSAGTPFSYAVTGQANELVLMEWNSNAMELFIHDQAVRLPITLSDNKWHHVCVTWTSRDGTWEAFQDGAKKGSGQNLSPWKPITPGGVFILGQEQDSVGGSFDVTQAFLGSLSDLQLWSRVLSPFEVRGQAWCGPHMDGDLLSWSEEHLELHGGLTVLPFDHCH